VSHERDPRARLSERSRRFSRRKAREILAAYDALEAAERAGLRAHLMAVIQHEDEQKVLDPSHGVGVSSGEPSHE